MSKQKSINLNTVFNEIFNCVCSNTYPEISYSITELNSKNVGNSVVAYNSSGNYYIGDYLPQRETYLDFIPPISYPQYIWIDVIQKTQCDDLKDSVPKYPVSNYSIDKDGTSIIEVACSGFEEDEIAIEREDLKLLVKGKRKNKEVEEDKKYLYKNIACRDFEIYYDVSEKWDFSKLEAQLKNGVLTILIPIKEECKPIRQSFKLK